MKKDITYKKEALVSGLNQLADAVKVTLGPGGQNVAYIDSSGNHTVTKDGVTVAEQVWLKDEAENMGAQLAKQVAKKTADSAGDGSTTSTILAQVIVNEGSALINSGKNPVELKRELEAASEKVLKFIKTLAKPIESKESMREVALVSSNGDVEVADMVVDALSQVGKDGGVQIVDSPSVFSKVEVVAGAQYYGGLAHNIFVTDQERQEADLENPLILIIDTAVDNPKEILPYLEYSAKKGQPLLIFCNELKEQTVLASLVVNRARHGHKVFVAQLFEVKNFRKDRLQDLATLTGATVYTSSHGTELRNAGVEILGTCQRAIVGTQVTMVLGGNGDTSEIETRVNYLKNLRSESTSPFEKEALSMRISQMTGGVATLYIGGTTPAEVKERKDRVDDAYKAVRAALEEGVVPGGGVAYLRAANILGATQGHGHGILSTALWEPIKTIAANSGAKPDDVAKKVNIGEADFGYNARTGTYGSMYEMGVVDPAKVVRLAIESSISIAVLILTNGAIIVPCESDEQKS